MKTATTVQKRPTEAAAPRVAQRAPRRTNGPQRAAPAPWAAAARLSRKYQRAEAAASRLNLLALDVGAVMEGARAAARRTESAAERAAQRLAGCATEGGHALKVNARLVVAGHEALMRARRQLDSLEREIDLDVTVGLAVRRGLVSAAQAGLHKALSKAIIQARRARRRIPEHLAALAPMIQRAAELSMALPPHVTNSDDGDAETLPIVQYDLQPTEGTV